MLSVPRRWGDVTPEWATAAIGRRVPDAVVGEVEIEPLGEGTNRRALVRLSYARGRGPESLFVKASGRLGPRLALLALGALRAEARLAASGVELPLEHPCFYSSGWRADRAVVVTEDLTASGGQPNVATSPLTPDQVAVGLSELAQLHAAFWGRPLESALSFLEPWRLGRRWAPVSWASLRFGLHKLAGTGRLDELVPPGVDAAQLERRFRESALRAREGAQTVLHGDPHPGNTYALRSGGIGFYDWQLVRIGNWSHDVAYFVIGSLAVEQRRLAEEDLLAGYLEDLDRLGVNAPRMEEAWASYSAAPAFGYATWLHTFSAGLFQPRDVCLATLERFAAAYCDLAEKAP